MASEKEKLTAKGFFARILEPHPKTKDTSLRQQAHLTILVSVILATASFVVGIIGLIAGFPASLIIGLLILTITTAGAYAMGRSENVQVGGIFLVSGLILGSFFIGATFSDITVKIVILTSTIIPAFTLSLVLVSLPTLSSLR